MLDRIRQYIVMFITSQRYMWLSFLIYRSQAIVWAVVWMFSTLASFISISVIYEVSSGIPGWSYYQMLALAALSNMVIGIVSYLIRPWDLIMLMRNGVFDQFLTKPYNTVALILSRSGAKASVGSIISALAMLIYALANQGNMSIQAVLVAVVLFALGAGALTMFVVFISVLSYVLFRSGNYIQWLINIAGTTSNYPLPIYSVAGIVLLTLGLPVGLATFYPAELMFLKIDYQLSIGIACISVILAFLFYKASMYLLRFYASGGG